MRAALVANSSAVGDGRLLYALELRTTTVRGSNPERFHRANGVLRYSVGDDADALIDHGDGLLGAAGTPPTRSRSARSTRGLIGRFGASTPPTAADARATACRDRHVRRMPTTASSASNAYAIQSKLDLFSNFTFLLERPGQRRPVRAGRAAHGLRPGGQPQLEHRDSAAATTINTLGLQVRHDRLDPVGLYGTVARAARRDDAERARVRETQRRAVRRERDAVDAVAAQRRRRCAATASTSTSRARSPQNSGKRNAGIVSPKLVADLRALGEDRVLRQLRATAFTATTRAARPPRSTPKTRRSASTR